MSRGIIKVTEALRTANKPLTGQELMAAAGYPSNSGTEQLERVFSGCSRCVGGKADRQAKAR